MLNHITVLLLLVLAMQQPRILQRARDGHDRTRIGTLNCRTLLSDARMFELDTALMAKGMDICALQETRRDGFLSFKTDNYIVYYFGECSGKNGVGIAVHNRFTHLISSPRGIPSSDGRLMTIDILLHDVNHPVTLICSYAPTSKATVQVRNKFYTQLSQLVSPNSWLLGDFNARIGRRSLDPSSGIDASNTIGPWSLKNDITPNSNGMLLLNLVSEHNLRHVSSHFQFRDSKRWTWRHPRYRSRAMLDHVFIPASHMRFVSRCFVPSDIAISTDHRPVICELNFRPRTTPKPPATSTKLNIRALNDPATEHLFQSEVERSLGDRNPENLQSDFVASSIRSATVSAATKTLPAVEKSKFPNEFQPATVSLIHRKRRLWQRMQKSGRRITRSLRSVFRSLCRETKLAIKRDRTARLEQDALDLTHAFNDSTFKGYALLKRQHRSRTTALQPPVSDFTEHYRAHYQLGDEEPLELQSCELPPSASDDILSRDEFDAGVRKLNSNRAPGQDNVAPEYIKHGGSVLLQWTFVFMTRIWSFVCDLPLEDRTGTLQPVPKKSGGAVVTSFRPICLLTSLYKLYAVLVFQKVCNRVKAFVSWTQAGFIRGRSCGNNLWILRRVAERAIEFNVPVYCILVDYKGAFDALNRTTLGRVLGLFLSPSMVRRVMCLYFDAKANVKLKNTIGPMFDLLRGVRQGCPASPSFFTVALAFISWTFRSTFKGIKLVHLFLSTIEYADDQMLFTLSPDGLQEMLDFLAATALPLGLRLAPEKCELICFHRPGTVDKRMLPVVKLGNFVVPWKSSVIYLGSLFSEDGNTLSVVKHRICCAETIVKHLNPRVFRRRAVSNRLKGNFINSAVFASLLYGLQYCAFGKREVRCLDGYFLRLAKRVMRLPHNHHLSYAAAERALGVQCPSKLLAKARLRWIGHALRSDDSVLTEVLNFVPEGGARGRGRPRRRFIDTVKEDLLARNINIIARDQVSFWSALADMSHDRVAWRAVVNRDV